MVKFKITDVKYEIEPEDVSGEISEDDFALQSDYEKACQNEIDKILDSLPSEMTIKLDNDGFNGSVEDEIADMISEKTGWLVQSFNYIRM